MTRICLKETMVEAAVAVLVMQAALKTAAAASAPGAASEAVAVLVEGAHLRVVHNPRTLSEIVMGLGKGDARRKTPVGVSTGMAEPTIRGGPQVPVVVVDLVRAESLVG